MKAMRPLPVVLASSLIVLTAGSSTAGRQQVTCTYDEPSKTVTVAAPGEKVFFVVLAVEAGAITFVGEQGTFRTATSEPCGAATTTNTDLIRFQEGSLGGYFAILDEAAGSFAPGATAEASGVSEIEVEFRAEGFLVMGGAPEQRVARLGTLGANVNGDDDVDVTFLTDSDFAFVGGPGNDDIAGTGGFGTGDPSTRFFFASGADGADLLVAGPGSVVFSGGAGLDVLLGGLAGDHLSGGSDSDRLLGGGGADDLVGEKGNDDLRGGPGPDDMNGGRGRDDCVGGPGKDTVKKCEN
jgi:Ca2+-binding RTX toxin-like protein